MRKQSKKTKGLGWLVFAAVLGALYLFRRESFWGLVGVLACPAIVVAVIAGAAKKSRGHSPSRGGRRGSWHISGQSDQQWAEENDRRILGEDY